MSGRPVSAVPAANSPLRSESDRLTAAVILSAAKDRVRPDCRVLSVLTVGPYAILRPSSAALRRLRMTCGGICRAAKDRVGLLLALGLVGWRSRDCDMLCGPLRCSRVSEFHDVAACKEIPEGKVRCYVVEHRKVAVANIEGQWFAVDDACPHRGGPLSEGDVEGCEIVCPWHFWSFDLRSGRHAGGSKFAVLTHDVRVANGRLLVRLSPPPAEPY